jgi:hypothetical protein
MNAAELTPEQLDAIHPCAQWPVERMRAAYEGAATLGLAGIVEGAVAAGATSSETLSVAANPYWLDETELRLLAVRYAAAVVPAQEPFTTIFAAIRAYVAEPATRPALETALDALRPAGAPSYAEWEAMPTEEKIWWAKRSLAARRPWAIASSIAFHDAGEVIRLAIKFCSTAERAAFLGVLRNVLQTGVDLRDDLPAVEG